MCGIAGRILNNIGFVGSDLVALMDAQSHRGADSTGFAVYSLPFPSGFKVCLMGFDRKNMETDLDDFLYILREHQSDFLNSPEIDETRASHYTARLRIKEPKNLERWIKEADSISNRIEVQSVGRSLEIIKDVGDANTVAAKHGVRKMQGTHGLGHARLATESNVSPNSSHPFWARPFPDVAIVHNGQITNYYTWRDRLERQGYRFMTDNDSELLAVWISDQMSKGLSQEQALRRSILEIDGVFTFLIGDIHGIGLAKDRFAMKPLVTIEGGNQLTAATEEQAVRKVIPEHYQVINYDGPALTQTWAATTLQIAV